MSKTIEINHGVVPFEDHVDTTRNNPDRKPWGKGDTDFHISDEYDQPTQQESSTGPETPALPQKFTHKMANGVVIEADSVEALAAKIEKGIQAATEMKWDDAPAYQPMEFKPRELSVQEQAMLLNQWGQNPQKVMRAIQEAEYGAPMERIIERLNRLETREAQHAQEVAGVEFLSRHAEEYNATPANAKKLTEYLKEKQKPITTNNLSRAFKELSAADQTLLRKQEPEVEEEGIEPPSIIQSNQGLPPAAPPTSIDVDKFRNMPLDKQKAFFDQYRRAR